MKDLGLFLGNLIEKFDIRKLLISAFVVLAFMLIPKIDFLKCIMPLNTAEKWIKFIFGLIAIYILQCLLEFICKKIKVTINNRPKRIFWTIKNYGNYISVFLSKDICEYSNKPVDFAKYNIPDDVIYKLLENNIVEENSFNYSEYRLTKRARKKLNRTIKLMKFILRVLDDKNGGKQKNNG